MSIPPRHTKVLVIGGGPAGSYAAAALAREGIQVTLFEQSKFPRYHIGESLIPSIRHHLRFIGAEEKMINHGFMPKPGSAIKFKEFKREGYTDFVALGMDNNAWNVVRADFDSMLLNHARSVNASVYEQTKVEAVTFSLSDPNRPVSVKWAHTPPPMPPSPPASPSNFRFSNLFSSSPPVGRSSPQATIEGETSFDYLIDATGRTGVLSTRYFKNRHFNASLKNVAFWGYWRNVGRYGVGSQREGAPWFEALTDESGWAWFIPLHDGTTSVGIVMNEQVYKAKNEDGPVASPLSHFAAGDTSNLIQRYLSELSFAPGVVNLITESGILAKDKGVKTASDFSYSAPSYAGDGYRIVGDAGAFIDPFFSSGVHLAMTSALSAAATISASIRHHCSESVAARWHTQRVATSYTRFQVVVLSAYKQIRSQSDDVLSDIDEDNYDRAFAYLRPVIQGASDMGARLSETELQKSLDFCVKLFNPTSPEDHERLAHCEDFAQELLDVAAPIVDPSTFENTLHVCHPQHCHQDENSSDCERAVETRLVLNKINARRVVHAEYAINNLELEPLEGFAIRLERGKLGLTQK
ncbi:FAD binding domain-containing protein [Crepidotus variabilis]|uniref:FAD binding domain-containing protein n=1 Tax=Crepidotus variabilis TaxID=179855 RepID=A0A9P6E7M9_9AGAR|nr:FAD binding domain-containing protein [Crepidotus variabilis]